MKTIWRAVWVTGLIVWMFISLYDYVDRTKKGKVEQECRPTIQPRVVCYDRYFVCPEGYKLEWDPDPGTGPVVYYCDLVEYTPGDGLGSEDDPDDSEG